MTITYHPNKYESYPVEILDTDLARFRVRVRVIDGRKPFPSSGFFGATYANATGWVSANKCIVEADEPATSGGQVDAAYGTLDLQPDPRIARRESILAAFKEEPLTKKEANELFTELAEIDQSLQIHPSDTLQARMSAGWQMMDEIIF